VTKNHGYSRYFHELAFSLNLAIVVVWGGSATTPRFVLLQRLKSLFPPHEVFSANHAAGSQPVAMGCNLSDMYMSVLRVLSKWEWTMGLLSGSADGRIRRSTIMLDLYHCQTWTSRVSPRYVLVSPRGSGGPCFCPFLCA